MKNLDVIEKRIEKAKTLAEVNKILDDLEKIVRGEVSIDEAWRIDEMMEKLRKKTLTVKVA